MPLHPSTIGALRAYAGLRDARFPTPSTPAFFLSARDGGWAAQELNATFTKLVRQIGLEGRGARARPRPHDLRHAFAVHTLLDWYRDRRGHRPADAAAVHVSRARRPGQHLLVPRSGPRAARSWSASRLEQLPEVLS